MKKDQDIQPLVSVILPVYNAGKYVRESIVSILDQTYGNFELIILNDGSTDNSAKAILSVSDERIIYTEHANMGLAATLNKGISMAKGTLIARQDNDDISLPTRIREQVNFLNNHPNTGLVGTWAEIINEAGISTGRFHKHPTDSADLKFALLFDNPFVHSSVMFRKDVIEKVGAYSTDNNFFEDYELWSRMARATGLANFPKALLKYREVNSGMSKTTLDYSAKRKRQAFNNILFYCPRMKAETIEQFLDHSGFASAFKDRHEAERKYKLILEEIAGCFCAHEKIPGLQVKKQVEHRILAFRRSMLNQVIYSDVAGPLEKTKAKLARKWLFTFHKNLLDS